MTRRGSSPAPAPTATVSTTSTGWPGSEAQFAYDGRGNRLSATRDGVTTHYIYDPRGNLLAEADGSNHITRKYIYGQGLLAMATADARYCYHFNATGSTIALTDMSQSVANRYAYEPFGQVLSQQETLPQPFKFVGQYGVMAEPGGLYYMRARYYDPSVGRFISEDPIGFAGGDINLYGYVLDDPVNLVDPFGLQMIGVRPGPGGGVPMIINPGTNTYSLGFPNSYVDPLTQLAREAIDPMFDAINYLHGPPLVERCASGSGRVQWYVGASGIRDLPGTALTVAYIYGGSEAILWGYAGGSAAYPYLINIAGTDAGQAALNFTNAALWNIYGTGRPGYFAIGQKIWDYLQ
jgi:RHS repeat-associated protein